jgi:hypothetical protein
VPRSRARRRDRPGAGALHATAAGGPASALRRTSPGPEDRHVAGGHRRVGRDEREPLDLRLRDEEAIEGVAVVERQHLDASRVAVMNRQRREILLLDPAGEPPGRGAREDEPAQGDVEEPPRPFTSPRRRLAPRRGGERRSRRRPGPSRPRATAEDALVRVLLE